MKRLAVVTVLALSLAGQQVAIAQTANSSPTSGTGAGGSNVTRTAPSGGTTQPLAGQPQIGAPTPLEEHEEDKSKKETTICKGC